jgi:hypothetical protein
MLKGYHMIGLFLCLPLEFGLSSLPVPLSFQDTLFKTNIGDTNLEIDIIFLLQDVSQGCCVENGSTVGTWRKKELWCYTNSASLGLSRQP